MPTIINTEYNKVFFTYTISKTNINKLNCCINRNSLRCVRLLRLFNDYFILQFTTIDTNSEFSQDAPAPLTLINDFTISEEKILNVIRSLNPNKAHGWDEISLRMIKSADASVVTPLMVIFTNCLRRGVFPEIWKCANIVPAHKKNEKNRKSNYRPLSILPIFGKILEKLVYDSLSFFSYQI